MENFEHNIPTKIYFGKGQIKNLASAIKDNGGSKILFVYGGGSIKQNGIYSTVISELKKQILIMLNVVELSQILQLRM